MTDSFETFLEQEIGLAERVKEQLSEPLMRMTYVGQIAAFKASLECYRRYKKLDLETQTSLVQETP